MALTAEESRMRGCHQLRVDFAGKLRGIGRVPRGASSLLGGGGGNTRCVGMRQFRVIGCADG